MAAICSLCSKVINRRYDDYLECVNSKCSVSYHRTCLGINENVFTDMEQTTNLEKWHCKNCKDLTSISIIDKTEPIVSKSLQIEDNAYDLPAKPVPHQMSNNDQRKIICENIILPNLLSPLTNEIKCLKGEIVKLSSIHHIKYLSNNKEKLGTPLVDIGTTEQSRKRARTNETVGDLNIVDISVPAPRVSSVDSTMENTTLAAGSVESVSNITPNTNSSDKEWVQVLNKRKNNKTKHRENKSSLSEYGQLNQKNDKGNQHAHINTNNINLSNKVAQKNTIKKVKDITSKLSKGKPLAGAALNNIKIYTTTKWIYISNFSADTTVEEIKQCVEVEIQDGSIITYEKLNLKSSSYKSSFLLGIPSNKLDVYNKLLSLDFWPEAYYQNVRGLRTKLSLLKEAITSTNFDIIIFSETWLTSDFCNAELGIPNHNIYRKDRSSDTSSKKLGGGVLIAVNTKFATKEINLNIKSIEQVAVMVSIPGQKIIFSSVYLPPDCQINNISTFCSNIEDLAELFPDTTLQIYGDFNLPGTIWKNDELAVFTIGNSSVKVQLLSDTCALLNLYQVNDITNANNVYLDLVFSSIPNIKVEIANDILLPCDSHHPALIGKIPLSEKINWMDYSYQYYDFKQGIGEASVQLQEPESASYIERGGEVILRCHLDATGDVQVEWFRNTDRLIKTSRIDIRKKRLHIKEVQPSDNGVYRCTARNQAGFQHSVKNFALAVAGDQTPLIQVVPSDQLVKNSSTAYFDCVYQNYDAIEWFFKDIPLTTNNRITIHTNGSLHINDVQEADKGFYKCVGIKSESSNVPQTYTAELKLAYLKNFTTTSFEPILPKDSKQIVAVGSLFQLTCLKLDSLPHAKQWWLNPTGHTISDSGAIRVDDDGRLIIDKVEAENAGKYTCVAENIAGKTEKAIELIVTTKPLITMHPLSITVDEGKKSVLTCEYSSKSINYTIIRWRKDGKIFNDEDGVYTHQRLKIFKQNGTLIINPTLTSDRGEYICEVITTGFKAVQSKPATISVIEQLKFSPPPVNKRLELGTATRVHCKAQGTPPPIIHWKKNGKTSEIFDSHVTDINGTLHFNGVHVEDKGQYICIASNSQGTINVTINIDVVVAPKFSILPKNPTEAMEGQSVMIDCVVEGDPKPTIQWDRNLKLNDLDPARFTVMDNGTLYIKEVRKEDEDKYGCTAGSSAGLNRKEVQLIVHLEGSYPTDGDSAVTKAVLITMSVAGAYIILVIGLMVWCRYRRRSRKLPVTDSTKTENGEVDHELKDGVNGHAPGSSKIETNGVDTHKDGQKSDGTETANSHSSNHSNKSKSSYDKLALSRTHLKGITFIGRGEFGDVLIAKVSKSVIQANEKSNSQIMTPNVAKDKEISVLVKQLTHTKDEQCLAEFKRELDMFAKMSHENIIKLHGLCRESEPHYMIMEHTDWGDLKQFLVATKKGNPPPLTAAQCVAIIQQLARGMDYLSSSRFIHKDLAARNCLVTSTLIAKIGMPRLTREPYSQEYSKHMNQIIPLRWLPYEAVYEDDHSTKSDIYAFGVVMWEIFNQGELPFPKMNDNSLLSKLKEKKLEWRQHSSTPEGLQKIQEMCVDINPQNRPGFSQLVKEIEEILKTM